MKFYTGIGSRSTPPNILRLMGRIARQLRTDGWHLRSGAAPGADSAFEAGALGVAEIYLPWPKYEGRRGPEFTDRPTHAALTIAARFHPAWDRLSQGARKLHARNVHQVVGLNTDRPFPSKFVICWTPQGKGGGGTGQAIRIAKHYDVPVFDLGNPDIEARLRAWLDTKEA